MKILLIDNIGGGFADHIEVEPKTTIDQLFADCLPHCQADDSLIRVNCQPVPSDQILHEGVRGSIIPIKTARA